MHDNVQNILAIKAAFRYSVRPEMGVDPLSRFVKLLHILPSVENCAKLKDESPEFLSSCLLKVLSMMLIINVSVIMRYAL